MHVHVQCAEGEAKYWLEAAVELAHNYGLSERQLRSVKVLIETHADDVEGRPVEVVWGWQLNVSKHAVRRITKPRKIGKWHKHRPGCRFHSASRAISTRLARGRLTCYTGVQPDPPVRYFHLASIGAAGRLAS